MALKLNYNVNLQYECLTDIELLNKVDNTITNKITKEIIVENTYIKITNQEGDKNNIKIIVTIFDKKDGNIVNRKYYSFIPNVEDGASNFIKQGYEFLKTLDEYKDAIDILEDIQ